MNRINVVEHDDGTYDFQILDAGNNRLLCSSHQGYDNRADCLDTAHSATSDPVSPEITFSRT